MSDEKDTVILTYAPAGALARRRAALAHYPSRKGFARHEFPPAISQEGGAGASVRYISVRENRSVGALLGQALKKHCVPGGKFRMEVVD